MAECEPFKYICCLPEWLNPVIKLAEKRVEVGNNIFKALHNIVQKNRQISQTNLTPIEVV
ncbi:MAG TPA: hypothetical protein QF468_09110 [Nitrospinota bacterium]|jgi:hypothetical protein|nr:hypothetical protein [Nitrospinota bacterium]|tara:strand:- start:7515 stop:7694 length:180 start_codon:yes stop_codon:yes gene_type:complete